MKQFIKGNGGLLFATITFSLLANIALVLTSNQSEWLFDALSAKDVEKFTWVIMVAVGYIFIIGGLFYIYLVCSRKLIKKVNAKLREKSFNGIMQKDMKTYYQQNMKASAFSEITGFKKIERAIWTYQEFSKLNKTFISSTIRANEISNNVSIENASPYQIVYMNLYKEMFNYIATLFFAAQEDASIRGDLDATKLAIFTILTVTGFLNMQELTSERFNSRFGLSENEIIDFTITRLLANLKG